VTNEPCKCRRRDSFGRSLAGVVAAWIVITLVCNFIGVGVDDSDAGPWQRSGVSIITDHKTGLQYLSTWTGGITPRVDADGRQVRVVKEGAN
jgi:hypothetical protein